MEIHIPKMGMHCLTKALCDWYVTKNHHMKSRLQTLWEMFFMKEFCKLPWWNGNCFGGYDGENFHSSRNRVMERIDWIAMVQKCQLTLNSILWMICWRKSIESNTSDYNTMICIILGLELLTWFGCPSNFDHSCTCMPSGLFTNGVLILAIL
jgi:hypothetical protein